MDESELINEAQGYVELGLFEDAWQCIERAPDPVRTSSEALRIKMLSAMGLERFNEAEEFAVFLAHGEPSEARSAGKILKELAAINHQAGDIDHARRLLVLAVEADSELGLDIMKDPALKGLF